MKKKSKDCNDESSNNETFKKSEMCCESSDNIKRKEKEEMDSSEVEVKKKKNKKSKEMDSNVEEDLEGTGLCIKEFNLISEYKKDKKEKLLCSDRFIRNCFIDKEVYMQLFYLQTTVVEVEKKSEKKKLKEKEE